MKESLYQQLNYKEIEENNKEWKTRESLQREELEIPGNTHTQDAAQ